jgi:pimeloyl-ACP methyl ester carboxylesterase
MGWTKAWAQACETLDGVTRGRVRGGEPGVEIAYLDWGGDGDLVLLQHANGFCSATLAPIAKALSRRNRVVSMDVRGHGDSTPVEATGDSNPYDWKFLSADLRAAVRELLDVVERDRVELAIGHSFSGALLLDVAQNEPALFGNLLLCDPVIFDSEVLAESEPRARGKMMATGARRRRDRFETREAAYEHFRTRALFANFTPEALALYVGEGTRPTADGEFILKCSPEVEAAVFSSVALKDLHENVDQVTANVTFLHALQGNFERARYDAVAKGISTAQVETLDVGHLFPMEEPDRVLEFAKKLIQ